MGQTHGQYHCAVLYEFYVKAHQSALSPQIAIFMHLARQTKRLAHPLPKINVVCRQSEHRTPNYMPWAKNMANIVDLYWTDFT